MPRTAIILGSTGRFGRNSAEAFSAAGWNVVPFRRGQDDLGRMARTADVVVNGWNPPYQAWAREVPGLQQQITQAMDGTDATLIVPGNVYVFGPGTPGPWGADTAHRAQNPLGRIRVEMERHFRASGVRTIILRAGDYLDTTVSGNWFDRIMAPSLAKGSLTYPGDQQTAHAWAYLPDLARAAVDLAEQREALPAFCDVPFPGYTMTGAEIVEALAAASGTSLRLKQMNWTPLRALSPVWPMARCLCEMRYLWNTGHALDGSALTHLLPGFRTTPVGEALMRAVQGAGVAIRSTQTSRWRLAASAAS